MIRHFLLFAIVAASPFAAVSFAAVSAVAVPPIDRSPLATKQSGSAYSLCQAELRRRMGGTQASVSISAEESVSSATTTRLTGQGTYRRDGNSRSQQFNFSCTVNLEQRRVVNLSYVFTNILSNN